MWSYVNGGYPVLGDAPVQAEMVTISFVDGDTVVEKQIEKGSVLDYTPEPPTKEGYTFVGWFEDVDNINTSYENKFTYSENKTYTAKYAHVQLLGAQVKAVVNEKSGIRFGTKIFNDGDEIIEKGTIILPINLLKEGEKLTLSTDNIAVSVGRALYEINKEENSVTYLGTLVNMSKTKFDTQITASAYVKYRDKAGNEYTIYAPYKNGSISINQLLNK